MLDIMNRRCTLRDINNGEHQIELSHKKEVIIGRGPDTEISDKRCSRHQVSVTADVDLSLLEAKQTGDNPSGVNGVALTKDRSVTLRHGDVLEVLLGKYKYRVVFSPPPSQTEGDGVPTAKKRRAEGGAWTSHHDGALLVFTPRDCRGKTKVAGFDLDHTVITTKSGRVFPKDVDDWTVNFRQVPTKLGSLSREDYKLVFFTNQHGIAKGKLKPEDFKKKVDAILTELSLPVQIFVSTGSGLFRKPATGMWRFLVDEMNEGVKVDTEGSLFCGDAAGRVANWAPKKKKDFSCSDRLFALNLGIKFYTPEEYFLGQQPAKFQLPAFDPRSLKSDVPVWEPTSASLHSVTPEVVVLVGYPGSGKSFFARTHMVPAGYRHVNRDTLGSWQRCVSATESALTSGLSVVVDNTAPDRESRRRYLEVAARVGTPCRCFVMSTAREHALHNLRFREVAGEAHEKVTEVVVNSYRTRYEEPALEEGFADIIKVNFVPSFANSELEKLYKMFLLDK